MTDLHARLARHNTTLNMINGLGGGGVNRLNIKNSRFVLESADGEKIEVDTLYLDVVLLVGNPNVSKQYYEGAYTGAAGVAPTCYSHNGVGPSTGASMPQAKTCAECPHNRWGTSTEQDGSAGKGKACQDRKLVAFIATKYAGKSYQLNLPPASLTNLYAYIKDLTKGVHAAGRPLEPFDFITRITFDSNKRGQVLQFSKGAQLGDKQLEFVASLLESDQTAELIQLHDKPRVALPAPAHAAPAQIEAPAPAQVTFVQAQTAQDRIAAARAQAQTVQVAPGRAEAPAAVQSTPSVFAQPQAAPSGLDGMITDAGFGAEFEDAMSFGI